MYMLLLVTAGLFTVNCVDGFACFVKLCFVYSPNVDWSFCVF